jgi:hypothetical protein
MIDWNNLDIEMDDLQELNEGLLSAWVNLEYLRRERFDHEDDQMVEYLKVVVDRLSGVMDSIKAASGVWEARNERRARH